MPRAVIQSSYTEYSVESIQPWLTRVLVGCTTCTPEHRKQGSPKSHEQYQYRATGPSEDSPAYRVSAKHGQLGTDSAHRLANSQHSQRYGSRQYLSWQNKQDLVGDEDQRVGVFIYDTLYRV